MSYNKLKTIQLYMFKSWWPFGPQYNSHPGHLHASLMGAIPLCSSCIFLLFTSLVCLFWVIVVVELNCEIHIAHNLKIKLLKVKFILHFLTWMLLFLSPPSVVTVTVTVDRVSLSKSCCLMASIC